jgi:hypothetical protein
MAVLVRGVTWVALNSSLESVTFAAFVAAKSFDSFNIFSAAFALLLGLFFGFGMVSPDRSSF